MSCFVCEIKRETESLDEALLTSLVFAFIIGVGSVSDEKTEGLGDLMVWLCQEHAKEILPDRKPMLLAHHMVNTL